VHPTLLASPISPGHLLSSFGVVGVAIVLFAETGLLIGFFLPGDTLLLAAGITVAIGTIKTPLAAFLVVAPLAAIIGNIVGYFIGLRGGPLVLDRPNSRLFRPEYVERTQRFFDRFGWATVFLARFVPIVRTVVTVLAGVTRMPFARYLASSIIGGIVWTEVMILGGYWLGHFSFVRRHEGDIDYVILAVVILGLIPALVHALTGRRRSARP